MFYTSSLNGMIPQDKPSYLYPHVEVRPSLTCSIRPSYVIVVDHPASLGGNLYFNFSATGSKGDRVHGTGGDGFVGTPDGEFIDFTNVSGSNGRLDISPVAWSSSVAPGGTDAAQGTVIFVYNDGTLGSM